MSYLTEIVKICCSVTYDVNFLPELALELLAQALEASAVTSGATVTGRRPWSLISAYSLMQHSNKDNERN